jgi:hypothetical protein
MGDAFDTEVLRSNAFDEAMGDSLLGVGSMGNIYGHKVTGTVGRVYRLHGKCIIFREDKNEISTVGDAHTGSTLVQFGL